MAKRRPVIGVMGGGSAPPEVSAQAELLGEAIAREGWILLTGGRNAGVMAAASRGARRAGGLVVGIHPAANDAGGDVSPDQDVVVFTGMGDARNAINALTSDVVIALPGGAGTASEIALALKRGKPVILLGFEDQGLFREGPRGSLVRLARAPGEAMAAARELVG